MTSPKTVLLVENDLVYRDALERTLNAAGWTVTVAFDVETVKKQLENLFQLDSAVIDLMLPPGQNLEGLEVCLMIQRRFPKVHTLILTNRADDDALLKARGIADKVLQKNAFVEEILAAIAPRDA